MRRGSALQHDSKQLHAAGYRIWTFNTRARLSAWKGANIVLVLSCLANLCRSNPDANRNTVRLLQSAASSIFEVGSWPKAADSAAATCPQLSGYAGRSANADSDDPAGVYQFDLAQDSEMTSPTMPI
jgi:hypothetical protein